MIKTGFSGFSLVPDCTWLDGMSSFKGLNKKNGFFSLSKGKFLPTCNESAFFYALLHEKTAPLPAQFRKGKNEAKNSDLLYSEFFKTGPLL